MKKLMMLVVLMLILIGCSNNNNKNKRLVFKENIIEVTIDSIEEQELPAGSEITFKLWGYDTQVADAKATLLNEYTYELSKLPVTYGLDYKKEWDKKITPGDSGEYGYYVTVEIKSGDSKEYKVDYNSMDKEYFGTKKTNIRDVSGLIFIKKAI